MSKKIVIPHCQNPFEVIINGKRYVYESGKEIEVSDEVAEVIQFHVDSKPRPKPADGGSEEDSSGGGAKLYRHDITLRDEYIGMIDVRFTLLNSDPTNYSIKGDMDNEIEADLTQLLSKMPTELPATGYADVTGDGGEDYNISAVRKQGNSIAIIGFGYDTQCHDTCMLFVYEVIDTVTQIM